MKKISMMLTAFVILLLCSACMPWPESTEEVPQVDPNAIPPETVEELYSYYNQVDRTMTREQVEALFGPGVERKDEMGEVMYIAYVNEKKSCGVNILYNFEGVVRAKTLYYNQSKDLIPFANGYTEDALSEIKEKDKLSRAEELFGGKGLEIVCEYSQNNPIDESKIYSWYNADGSSVQLHVQSGRITQKVWIVAEE